VFAEDLKHVFSICFTPFTSHERVQDDIAFAKYQYVGQ